MSSENVVFVRTTSKPDAMAAFLKPYVPYLSAKNPIYIFGYDLFSAALNFPSLHIICEFIKIAGEETEIWAGPSEDRMNEVNIQGINDV